MGLGDILFDFVNRRIAETALRRVRREIEDLDVKGTRARAQAVLAQEDPDTPWIHADQMIPPLSVVAWSLLPKGDDLDTVEAMSFGKAVSTNLRFECQRGGVQPPNDEAVVKARFRTKNGELISAQAFPEGPLRSSDGGLGFIHPFFLRFNPHSAHLARVSGGLVARSVQMPLGGIPSVTPPNANFLHVSYWADVFARIGLVACGPFLPEDDHVMIRSFNGLKLPPTVPLADRHWQILSRCVSTGTSSRGFPLSTAQVVVQSGHSPQAIGGGHVTFASVPHDLLEARRS